MKIICLEIKQNTLQFSNEIVKRDIMLSMDQKVDFIYYRVNY